MPGEWMCARHVSVSIPLTHGSYSDAMCWTPPQASVDGSEVTAPASDAVTHLSEVRTHAWDPGAARSFRTRPETRVGTRPE